MKKIINLKSIERKIVTRVSNLIPKHPTIRNLFNLYAFANLKILDRKLRNKYSKNYNFSRVFMRLITKNKNPVFIYEECKNLIWIINKLKKPKFFEELYPNKSAEASIYLCLEKVCEGEYRRGKIKNAWSKNSIRPEDIRLMMSFLNNYPNYALNSLKSWLEPAPHFIIREERIFDSIADKNGTILDIGCSFNPFVDEYTSIEKNFFVGVDLSIISLKIGEILTPKNKGHLVCANAEMLPFKSSSCDIIVCTEVMEHLAFPEKLLQEIFRLLKHDGICVLSVPCHVVDIQSLSLEKKRDLLKHSDATHRIDFYTYNDLVNLFEKNNLRIASLKENPYYIFKLVKR